MSIIYRRQANKMTYAEFIENRIYEYGYGAPIYTGTIAQELSAEFQMPVKEAASAVSVALKRLIDRKAVPELRCFQKGIYYRAKATPFGETGINKNTLIADKYLAGDNGYETGLALLHHIGLTTQIPAEKVFATNRASGCIRADKALGVSVCPPKVRINAENKPYLQTLDAIDAMAKAPVDAERPYLLLADHIQKAELDYGKLLALAEKYYSKNTVLNLAHIAGERI